MGFPGGTVVKNVSANTGDTISILGSGRSLGRRNGNPLQHSCLENPMDRGAWQATVHGVSKSQTQLRDFTYGFCGPEISKKLGSKLCLDVSREAAIRYRMDLHSSENLTGNGGSTSEVAHSPNLQIGVGYGWSSFSTWITPHGLGLCKTW